MAVDPYSKEVLARIPVARGPHNVAASPNREQLLVTSPPAGRVTFVDGVRRRTIKVFSGFAYPHDVEFGPGWGPLNRARFAYVTDERRGELVVIDIPKLKIVRRVQVGAGAHALALRPDGARVWVTHGPREARITIVDTSVPAKARVVGYAASPGAHDIAFAPDGLYVWVTYWDSGIVGQIRAYPRTGRLRLHQRAGELVHHVQVQEISSKRGWELWATDHGNGRTYRLARSGRPVRTLTGCPGAHHVAFVGDAAVVVACHDADAIAVYDRRTWRRTLAPAGAGPHGVAVIVA